MAAWRLLVDGRGEGPWNMGVDEALLASAQQGGFATLRFYRWQGPWLSLGYGQELSAERAAACATAGVGVVQRTTGGRAVLHGEDWTYAIAAPEALLPPGLQGSYALVAEAISEALTRLGVRVERRTHRERRAGPAPFDCFEAPAEDELLAGGRKLVGSAQRRAGGAVLQHGSIRLRPDSARAREAVGFAAHAATSLAELGVCPDDDALLAAFGDAFTRALGEKPEPGGLSSTEHTRASARVATPARAVPVPGDRAS